MAEFEDDDIPLTIFGGSLLPAQAPVADPKGHYLVVLEGPDPGKCVEVATDPITLGRDGKQTLAFPGDAQVSRAHARVSLVNGRVVAEDLGSTNGTFVNTQRITAPVALKEADVLRVGQQILKYERRSRRDVERAHNLSRDLHKASSYALALLPGPITDGPVRADWHFQPSTQLGGDAFGYYWLNPTTFIFYLVDVSGHGVGSAMHSVTVMNVLRQRALPGVDFTSPSDVLSSLNDRFQMDTHHGMFFTMWYGVYRMDTRTLAYSSAGHHPAFLVPPTRSTTQPLGAPAFMIGAFSEQTYDVQETRIATGSTLYLFSDGVFEIVTKDQQNWSLEDFLPLLLEPTPTGTPEPQRLFRRVSETAKGDLEDDFSLLAVTFL